MNSKVSLLFAGLTRDLLLTMILSSVGSHILGFCVTLWNTTGSLIVEKFLAVCALRCHSMLLFISMMRLLGGRIRSMGMT